MERILVARYDMIVLIGFGNPLRRDDGAGPALARMIAAAGGPNDIKVITHHQLVPELALDLAETGVLAVLFLDACVRAPGEAEIVAIRPVGAEPGSPVFGHNFSSADLLHYAELLRGGPLPAWQLTIPGIDFGFGEGFSGYCTKNIAAAFEKLQLFLRSNSP